MRGGTGGRLHEIAQDSSKSTQIWYNRNVGRSHRTALKLAADLFPRVFSASYKSQKLSMQFTEVIPQNPLCCHVWQVWKVEVVPNIEIVCRFAWRYLLGGMKDPESLDRFLCRHFLYESHELVKKTLGNRGEIVDWITELGVVARAQGRVWGGVKVW